MRRESSNVDDVEARERKRRRDAVETLLEARERLFSQLVDDVLSNRDVILDGSSQDGLFSFEFQEIEDRYSARLHALNALLENLEYRRPRFAHKVETVTTTIENLKRDLNALVRRHDQWDLINMNFLPLKDGKLLAVVGFSTDEYDD